MNYGYNGEIEMYEEMVDNKDLFQAIKENYPAMGAREFNFTFHTANFDKHEVNTMLSQADYDCWIDRVEPDQEGTVEIFCKCEIEEEE